MSTNPQTRRRAQRSAFTQIGWIIVLVCVGSAPLRARDAFVVLSGGASPMANNYSQYLQAKVVTTYFAQRYPQSDLWTFFGAGNREGEPPRLSDVRRQVKKDGLILETWLPGSLPRNRPAKRAVVLRAFREEILPAVASGGTLYLFVGDHGSLSDAKNGDAQIDLWGMDPDPSSPREWKLVDNEELTVTDLRDLLKKGLGKGRVVFCMTQCYSGGFQFLGIPREVIPNARWFTRGNVPAWVKNSGKVDAPLAAGFTATDHYSLAAGCDPDPDPERWAGYERYVPEHLLGLDLFTLEPAGVPRSSFFAAHVESTLVDQTIDKPHSTSERYLERWATLIETRLMSEKYLTPEVQKAVIAYHRAVDDGLALSRDPALAERQALFARFSQRLTEQSRRGASLISTGSRAELDKVIGPLPDAATFTVSSRRSRSSRGGPSNLTEARKLWKDVIGPAWKGAVLSGTIPELNSPYARAFEESLLAEEEKGRNLLFGNGGRVPTALVYWASGATHPRTQNPEKAEAVAIWAAQRRATIVGWTRSSPDRSVKEAAEKAFSARRNRGTARATPTPMTRAAPGENEVATATVERERSPLSATTPVALPVRSSSNELTRPLSRKTAAERALFYRRVLAAWAFLVELKESDALEKVRQLTELERTPLPGRTESE